MPRTAVFVGLVTTVDLYTSFFTSIPFVEFLNGTAGVWRGDWRKGEGREPQGPGSWLPMQLGKARLVRVL